MIAWWNNLTLLQQIFAILAIPSTLILVIQSVLLLFGIGDGDSDGDGIPDSGGDGLTLFTVRGIVALFCVGGWSGMVFLESGIAPLLAVLLAIVCGIAALVGIAFLFRLILKLQSSGNIEIGNAIGKVGQVYLTIPPKAKGSGKVNLVVQDKYTEMSAITEDADEIKTGELVRVLATDEAGILVVSKVVK